MTIRRNIRCMVAVSFVAVASYSFYWLPLLQSELPISSTRREQQIVKSLMTGRPLCSVDVIRNYCLEHNYFPTGGRWINSSYFPDLCRFRSNDITKERLRECLTRRHVTKIVVLGDSNGLRYFLAAKKLLEKFLKCRKVKIETGFSKPDVTYFTKGTKLNISDIVVHHRDCGGCRSVAGVCRDDTTEINIEYIVMEFFVDTEITTVRNMWKKNCHPSKEAPLCRQSNTNQEFILKEYLEGSYPDVILLFSGNHDKARSGLSKIRGDMEYLKMLIKTYVPKQTKLFWFTKISENLRQKGNYWRDVRFDGESKTKAFIKRINVELFDVLRTEFMETGGRILPFFDIYDMSLGVIDWTIARSGIHRKPKWYDVVLSNWVQTFCEQ